MKRMTKLLLFLALAFGIAGGAFGIVSLCSGFRMEEFRTALADGRFEVDGVTDWADDAGSFMKDVSAGRINFEETYSDVESLKLDVGVAKCTLLPSDTKEWKVVGYDVPSRFRCRKSGDTLEVSCRQAFWSFLNFGNKEAEMEIWIPRSQLLKKVQIDAGVGDLYASEESLRCEKLKIDCGVGDCDIWADIEERIEIDGGVGSVELTLVGREEDFNYDIDCGVGSVDVGEHHYSELGSDVKVDNGADKKIEIDCGVGSVAVKFEACDDEEMESHNAAYNSEHESERGSNRDLKHK